MKQYHKTGSRPGKPAYRTPATWRVRQVTKVARQKAQVQRGEKKF